MEENTTISLIKYGIIIIVLLTLLALLNPFVIIGSGERGVVMNWGAVSDKVLGEGLHTRLPFQQNIQIIDVKEVKYQTKSASYSKDTQTVDTEVAFNYQLDANKVNIIFQSIGNNKRVETVVIDPAIQESQKQVFAKFTAQELLDKRAIVTNEIKTDLSQRLQEKGIILKSFSIINFDFSDAYEKAVEEKQVAAQDALKAENKLKQVQFEADQRVAQAKAEAEAIKIQAEAITQQGGADYVKLKWIEAWAKGGAQVPQFVTGENGSSFLMNIGEIK
jgi:regulator of protease activity HflC (stomatin/prohibitin superfamily)